MKNFIVTILFLGVAAFVGLMLYDSWSAGDWLKEGSAPAETDTAVEPTVAPSLLTYPASLEVKSVDGRTIAIRLIARNSTEIQFERVTDGERFVYPMAQLVSESRTLVEAYPNHGLIAVEKEEATGLEDFYIEQLREGIVRIDDKIKRLSADYAKSQSSTEKRTIIRKVDDLKAERLDFEAKIDERK